MDKQKFAVIDIETTGLWYLTDKITRISIVMLEDDQIIDRFESLVNPETEISDYVEKITGVTNEMVATAPALKEVLQDALNFIGDAPLVAHNASFDQGFLNEGLTSIGQGGVDIICTKELCKRLYPHFDSHSLMALASELSLPVTKVHRTLSDVVITAHLFVHINNALNSG